MSFNTTSIKFTSRASVKIGDSYYTFEACIEKQCPESYTENEYEDAKNEQKIYSMDNGVDGTYDYVPGLLCGI